MEIKTENNLIGNVTTFRSMISIKPIVEDKDNFV